MQSVWMGVGLNFEPSDEGYTDLVRLSELVPVQGVRYFSAKRQPHLNLYDVDIPESALPQIGELLSEIAQTTAAQSLRVKGVGSFTFGALFLEIEKAELLTILEERVVGSLNPLRNEIKTEDYHQSWRQYTVPQQHNLETYGNPFVLDTFFPHISIGFLPDEKQLAQICLDLDQHIERLEYRANYLDVVIKRGDEIILRNRYLLGILAS